jgi:hypothetical protein
MPHATTQWLKLLLVVVVYPHLTFADPTPIVTEGPSLGIEREVMPYPRTYLPQSPRLLQPAPSIPSIDSNQSGRLLQSDAIPNNVKKERQTEIPVLERKSPTTTGSTAGRITIDNTRSDPMMQWHKIGFSAVLGAWLFSADVSMVRAQAEPTLADVSKQMTELKTMLGKLNTDLEKKINDYQDSNAVSINQLQKQINDLKSKISELQTDVADLRDQAKAAAARTSESKRIDPNVPAPMPSGIPSTSLKTGPGKVRFINDYVEELSIYVNGVGYRILPGNEVTVAVQPGNFTYQVLMLQTTMQTRSINAEEVKNIRIHVAR